MIELPERVIPGIRGKLSIFTGFFVISILSLISVLYLNQQYKSLEQSLDREMTPLRKYTEKIVLDLENISSSLLVIEDFRIRQEEKAKELEKYRRRRVHVRVVEEKSWFTKNVLSKLNYLKKDLVDTHDKKQYRTSYEDTFFSSYITPENIHKLEENIRSQMRDYDGQIISQKDFSAMQKIARDTQQANQQMKIKKQALANLSTPDSTKDIKDIATKQKKLQEEIRQKEHFYKTNYKLLSHKIHQFFYPGQRAEIRELGLNTGIIRIQSFLKGETEANFDTKTLAANQNDLNDKDFFTSEPMQKDLKKHISQLSLQGTLFLHEKPSRLTNKNKEYELYYRPIYKNSDIAFRSGTILRTMTTAPKSIWSKYLQQEQKIIGDLQSIIAKLKKRIQYLREKKQQPSNDKDFVHLYRQYNEQIQKRLALVNQYAQSSPTPKKEVIDSFASLRNAYLYEFALIRFQYNSGHYLNDEAFRQKELLRWRALRQWIMAGESETDIPIIKTKEQEFAVVKGGILAHSRSELEEEMWQIDTTPLFIPDKNKRGLAAILFLDNIAGYTRTAIDKNQGLSKIRSDMRKIVYNASVIGLAAIALAFFFSGMMVKNIRRLSKKAELVGRGKLDVKFLITSRDEIGKLSSTLNSMVNGLVERERVKSALGKFVNPEIAERVLKKELELGGEKKQAAIFFSDIRSFTSISEKLSPEEVVEFLNDYMTLMVKCINRSHGIVDKFIGDAIMATWGTAYSRGNDAENAVNAALAMRQSLLIFNKNRGSDKKPIIRIGCGLNYGEVIAGQIGSQERLEYTVIGDAVNLASRVEALNKPFATDILITRELYEMVEDIFLVEKMQEIKVKGKEKVQTIFAVIKRRDDPDGPNSLAELRDLLGLAHKQITADDLKEEVKYEVLDSKNK